MMIEINYHTLRELEKSGKKCRFAIGKGANDVYYTLWAIENSEMVGENMQVYCCYSQNLAQNKEDALKSYQKITGEKDALFIPFLTGESVKFESLVDFAGYFTRGKYAGEHITQASYDYIKFCVDNGKGGKLLEKYFDSLPIPEPKKKLTFGKYAGMSVDKIAEKDTDYLFWLCENCSEKINLEKYIKIFASCAVDAYEKSGKFGGALAKKLFKKSIANYLESDILL